MNVNFIFGVMILYYFTLLLQLLQFWPFGTFSFGLCVSCPFDIAPLFTFLKILTFWHYMMLQSHLAYFSFNSNNQQLPQETWSFLFENGIRKQGLGAGCYCGIIAFMSSQLTEQGNVCVHSNPCIFQHL